MTTCACKVTEEPNTQLGGVPTIVYCRTHALAFEAVDALSETYHALLELANANAGPPDYWNGDNDGNSACRSALAVLDRV
jgi:hypothetical protein